MSYNLYPIVAHEHGKRNYRIPCDDEATDEISNMLDDEGVSCRLYEFRLEAIEAWAARTTIDGLREWLCERIEEARARGNDCVYIAHDFDVP